jgi:tetratricopeptide (TPR) repeat protein
MDPNSHAEPPPAGLAAPSSRGRRIALVAAVALIAGGGTAAALLLGSDGAGGGATEAREPFRGVPPLAFPLPPEARRDRVERVLGGALRRPAAALDELRALPLDDRRVRIALAVAAYRRDDSGAALEALARLPADDPAVAFHTGLVLLWAGRVDDAEAALVRARDADRYGFYGFQAERVLFPGYLPSLPAYMPPEPVESLRAARRATRLRPDDPGAWLGLAAALPATRRPEALQAARRAAELAPRRLSPRIALAVLAFDKADPSASISTLGGLSAESAPSAELRFHLGLLVLWIGNREQARDQFEQARDIDPGGRYGEAAGRLLEALDA